MTADLSFDPSIPVADASTETDDIVYRISHDLRASVRALQELPIWISEDLDKASIALPKPTARHLEMITNHATRLDLMLTGLLEHSRVGRMQPISAVRPIEVLEDVIEDFGTPDGVDIQVKMDGGYIQFGHIDLRRLFVALLSNAVRFHPRKAPKITVFGGPKGNGLWRIEVVDDGAGIPETKREFVTRPMTKLVSRDVDPGAGMGLAIVRKIAELYGGSVSIDTAKSGVGTSVSVVLRVT